MRGAPGETVKLMIQEDDDMAYLGEEIREELGFWSHAVAAEEEDAIDIEQVKEMVDPFTGSRIYLFRHSLGL